MIGTSYSQPKLTSCDRDHHAVPSDDESATAARYVSGAQRLRADGVTEDWTGRYDACAADISGSAARAPLTLTGFSACVDAVYTVDARMLDTLTHVASRDHTGLETAFARAILERIAEARGGELFRKWDEGPAWAENLLGSPTRLQVGGTGPQAAWALAILGAPSVLALRDRSADQLSVLHPAISNAVSATPPLVDRPRTVSEHNRSGRSPDRQRAPRCEASGGQAARLGRRSNGETGGLAPADFRPENQTLNLSVWSTGRCGRERLHGKAGTAAH